MIFRDFEDSRRRSVQRNYDHYLYTCHYNVPSEALGLIPAEGSLLPGESVATGDTVLGPFILRGGIEYGHFDEKNGKTQVTVRAKKFIKE